MCAHIRYSIDNSKTFHTPAISLITFTLYRPTYKTLSSPDSVNMRRAKALKMKNVKMTDQVIHNVKMTDMKTLEESQDLERCM